MDGNDQNLGRRKHDLERLVDGMGGFLAQLAKRVRQGATMVAGLAAALGAVALLLGVWAWHDSAAPLVIVAAICLAAIAAPLFVLRRLKPITEAVEHPDETARQARDYFAALQSTPELNQVVDQALALQKGSGKVRVRGAFKGARLVSSLIGSVAPDPKAQPLVAAFHPTRLRSIWLAVLASWWLAILAMVLAMVSAVAIIADAIA